MQLVTVLVLGGCLAVGMGLGLLASLKLQSVRHPDSSPYPVGTLVPALNFAALGLLVVAALPVDALGIQAGITGGAALVALSLFGMVVVLPTRRAVPFLVGAGLGAGAVYLALFPLLPAGLLGEGDVTASFLFGLVFIGLGALLGRPLFDVLSAVLGYRSAVTALAVGWCSLAVLGAMTPPDSFPAGNGGGWVRVVMDGRLWMAGVVFAFYAPLEAFVSVWITTFLSGQGRAEEPGRGVQGQASGWVAWFWLAFLASRVLIAILLHVTDIRDSWLPAFLILPALLAAVVLGNLSGSTYTRQALSGVIGLGFILGPVLPVLLAIVAEMRRDQGGLSLALALLHVCGAAGGMLLSPLVKSSAEAKTAQSALRIPLFMALLLTAAAVLFGLTSRG